VAFLCVWWYSGFIWWEAGEDRAVDVCLLTRLLIQLTTSSAVTACLCTTYDTACAQCIVGASCCGCLSDVAVDSSSGLEETEQKILQELMEVVQQRDALVALLEEDRVKSVIDFAL